jgi:hypothetical protein
MVLPQNWKKHRDKEKVLGKKFFIQKSFYSDNSIPDFKSLLEYALPPFARVFILADWTLTPTSIITQFKL